MGVGLAALGLRAGTGRHTTGFVYTCRSGPWQGRACRREAGPHRRRPVLRNGGEAGAGRGRPQGGTSVKGGAIVEGGFIWGAGTREEVTTVKADPPEVEGSAGRGLPGRVRRYQWGRIPPEVGAGRRGLPGEGGSYSRVTDPSRR